MKILVTGGNGFVGGHLLPLLSKQPHRLSATWFHHRPSQTHPHNLPTQWHYCDFISARHIQKITQKEKPDLVFHLAAQASVAQSWKAPAETFQSNVLGTLFLLEALAREKRPCTLIVIESGEVYGRAAASHGKITENSPLQPENPYAASKASQDLLLYPYLSSPGLKIIRVRPLNHIGPGQNPDYVVSSFASQIAAIEAGKTQPILRVGNLKAKRDFTDVRDVVQAYVLLASKGKRGEIYNVASGKAVSIETLLKKLLQMSRVRIQVRTDPKRLRPNDIPLLYALPKKLKSATGWRPLISLEQSLEDTLNYWRKQYA